MNNYNIDVSGLSWEYRTGVQNLFWAYIEAHEKITRKFPNWNINFYDRSGYFNSEINNIASKNYYTNGIKNSNKFIKKLLRISTKLELLKPLNLNGSINQVWNWGIYNPSSARASITIPDILPIEYPDWFSNSFIKLTEKSMEFAKKDAEFIFCISNYIKSKIVEKYNFKESQIKVVYPGINQSFYQYIDENSLKNILYKYNLFGSDYIISSGFLDPRKNLKRQIEAFGNYIQKTKSPLKYVITGVKESIPEDIQILVNSPHLIDKVIFLGYVPQNELITLTSNAKISMYCSLAEGFGLPIIEAMALRTPILTSNTTSMVELAEGRSEIANPEDVIEIANKIESILSMNKMELLGQLNENYEYSKKFTAENWLEGHIGGLE